MLDVHIVASDVEYIVFIGFCLGHTSACSVEGFGRRRASLSRTGGAFAASAMIGSMVVIVADAWIVRLTIAKIISTFPDSVSC